MTDYSTLEFFYKGLWEGRVLHVRAQYGGEERSGTGTTGASGIIETKGGAAVWEDVERPYMEPLVVWRGPKEAYSHKIPIVLTGDGVEDACDAIETMAGIFARTRKGQVTLPEPPELVLDGYGAIPHDFTHDSTARWVIGDPPEWGEADRDPETGDRTYQAVTLTFKLLQSDKTLRRSAKQGHRHIIHVRGQTFQEIATHRLHNASWGTRLARINGYFNATEKPLLGEVELPTRQEEREWSRSKRR